MAKKKESRIHTLRGVVGAQEEFRIRLFDGRFDTGFRLLRIETMPITQTSGLESFIRAYTEPGIGSVNGQTWDWSDNREVGWASGVSSGGNIQTNFSLVDKDAIIIEDLYLRGGNAGDNMYYIELEKVDISEAAGALALVRNKSQGSDAA